MIDYSEMQRRRQQGLSLIESLQENELAVIMNYSSLAANEVLQVASSRKAPTNESLINAFRNGLALGLLLAIENGEVK